MATATKFYVKYYDGDGALTNETIEAENFTVMSDGSLLFFSNSSDAEDEGSDYIATYSPGRWNSVRRAPSEV